MPRSGRRDVRPAAWWNNCTHVSRVRRHESDHEILWALPIVVCRSRRASSPVTSTRWRPLLRLSLPSSTTSGLSGWRLARLGRYWHDGATRKVASRGNGKQFQDAVSLGCVRVDGEGADGFGPIDVPTAPSRPVQSVPRELKMVKAGGKGSPG